MSLHSEPVTFKVACEFVATWHRHHKPPQGWKFGIAAFEDDRMVGVVMVGRPVARKLDDGFTLEVTRCCTDGTKNAPSFLYSAAWRAARAMGYHRIIIYLLAEEPGTTMKAVDWRMVHQTPGKSWSVPSRPRTDTHPLGPKSRWEMADETKSQAG